MRKNDSRVIAVAAAAAGEAVDGFFVELSLGEVLVSHRDSMKWPAEKRHSVEKAVRDLTGFNSTVV